MAHDDGPTAPRFPAPDPDPDPTVMESAMDTGSEVGEPGDHSDGGPLSADERALLDRLEHDDREPVVTDAPEDSPAAARAAVDDTVLPDPAVTDPAGAGAPDEDTPEFREAP